MPSVYKRAGIFLGRPIDNVCDNKVRRGVRTSKKKLLLIMHPTRGNRPIPRARVASPTPRYSRNVSSGPDHVFPGLRYSYSPYARSSNTNHVVSQHDTIWPVSNESVVDSYPNNVTPDPWEAEFHYDMIGLEQLVQLEGPVSTFGTQTYCPNYDPNLLSDGMAHLSIEPAPSNTTSLPESFGLGAKIAHQDPLGQFTSLPTYDYTLSNNIEEPSITGSNQTSQPPSFFCLWDNCSQWVGGQTLMDHFASAHPLLGPERRQCLWENCGMEGTRELKKRPWRHIRAHAGLMTSCKHCSRYFTREDNLRRHIETSHAGL